MYVILLRRVLPLLTAIIGLTACTRGVSVTKQMTWECAPEEFKSGYYAKPDEYIRLRYVEEPRCFEVESARNLCAQLQSTGRSVVTVRFSAWGSRDGAGGYRIEEIEGKPLRDVGGWGGNGANDYSGPCPIGKVIESLRY